MRITARPITRARKILFTIGILLLIIGFICFFATDHKILGLLSGIGGFTFFILFHNT